METKKCKHCQTDIPKKAKVCPNCKRKQGGALKTVLIIFVVLLLIGGLFGNSESEEVTVKENTNIEAVEETKEKAKETTYGIGDIVSYNNVDVCILSYSESSGGDWSKPESGNIFVYPVIEISNNSDEELHISSMMSFNSYCDDYLLDYSSNALMAISTEDGMQALDMTIAPGKKAKGVLGLEVPTDWKTIEIYYKDNVWLDSNFSFVIEK